MQQLPILEGQIRPAETETAPPAPRRRRTWYVALVLCFFAAVIPETLTTTSTSVAKIIAQPGALLFIMLFYGLADLLIREALVRRRLGWVSLILLGIAFGFINEGVIAGTWYTVKYNGYVYIGQINYTWAVALTVFHVFISVIAPIAFIETIFPSRAGLPLLRRRGIIISSVIFLLLTSVFLFVESYRPYRIVVFALALTLAIVAIRLPAARPRLLSATPPPSLWRLRWAGFLTMLSFFVVIYAIPPLTLKLAGAHEVAAQAIDIVLFICSARCCSASVAAGRANRLVAPAHTGAYRRRAGLLDPDYRGDPFLLAHPGVLRHCAMLCAADRARSPVEATRADTSYFRWLLMSARPRLVEDVARALMA